MRPIRAIAGLAGAVSAVVGASVYVAGKGGEPAATFSSAVRGMSPAILLGLAIAIVGGFAVGALFIRWLDWQATKVSIEALHAAAKAHQELEQDG